MVRMKKRLTEKDAERLRGLEILDVADAENSFVLVLSNGSVMRIKMGSDVDFNPCPVALVELDGRTIWTD